MLRIAALVLVLLLFPAAASARVPDDWLGVAADGPLIDFDEAYAGEWALMADSGASSARVAFYWTQGQPLGPGAVDFTAYDRPVLRAARAGMTILPVVFSTPGWARRNPSAAASPPRDPADYAAFVAELARRYGPKGSFWTEHPDVPRRPIRAWQLWNEPNLKGYWSRQPFAGGYVKLLRAARRALRKVDPRARVVLAGLPNGWQALREIYEAGGKKAFDAVAIHPYTAKPARLPQYLRAVRVVMGRFDDRRTRLWVTELSWPAAKGRAADPIGIATTDAGQAKRLTAGLRVLAKNRRKLRIERVYWYTWLSRPTPDSVFAWSGLRRLEGDTLTPTPALAAFRKVAKQLKG